MIQDYLDTMTQVRRNLIIQEINDRCKSSEDAAGKVRFDVVIDKIAAIEAHLNLLDKYFENNIEKLKE